MLHFASLNLKWTFSRETRINYQRDGCCRLSNSIPLRFISISIHLSFIAVYTHAMHSQPNGIASRNCCWCCRRLHWHHNLLVQLLSVAQNATETKSNEVENSLKYAHCTTTDAKRGSNFSSFKKSTAFSLLLRATQEKCIRWMFKVSRVDAETLKWNSFALRQNKYA